MDSLPSVTSNTPVADKTDDMSVKDLSNSISQAMGSNMASLLSMAKSFTTSFADSFFESATQQLVQGFAGPIKDIRTYFETLLNKQDELIRAVTDLRSKPLGVHLAGEDDPEDEVKPIPVNVIKMPDSDEEESHSGADREQKSEAAHPHGAHAERSSNILNKLLSFFHGEKAQHKEERSEDNAQAKHSSKLLEGLLSFFHNQRSENAIHGQKDYLGGAQKVLEFRPDSIAEAIHERINKLIGKIGDGIWNFANLAIGFVLKVITGKFLLSAFKFVIGRFSVSTLVGVITRAFGTLVPLGGLGEGAGIAATLAAMGPVGWIIGGIIGAAIAAMSAYFYFGPDKLKAWGAKISGAASGLIDSISKKITDAFEPDGLGSQALALGEKYKKIVVDHISTIGKDIKAVLDHETPSPFGEVTGQLKTLYQYVDKKVSEATGTSLTSATSVIDKIFAVIGYADKKGGEANGEAVTAITNQIKGSLPNIRKLLGNVLHDIWMAFVHDVENELSLFKADFFRVGGWLGKFFTKHPVTAEGGTPDLLTQQGKAKNAAAAVMGPAETTVDIISQTRATGVNPRTPFLATTSKEDSMKQLMSSMAAVSNQNQVSNSVVNVSNSSSVRSSKTYAMGSVSDIRVRNPLD
jgi:hypothetical protein